MSSGLFLQKKYSGIIGKFEKFSCIFIIGKTMIHFEFCFKAIGAMKLRTGPEGIISSW